MTDDEIQEYVSSYPEWTEDLVRWELAKLDYYKARKMKSPDVKFVINVLSQRERDALRSSYRDREGYRVSDGGSLAVLRTFGLAGFNGPYLTTYGASARHVLLTEDTSL